MRCVLKFQKKEILRVELFSRFIRHKGEHRRTYGGGPCKTGTMSRLHGCLRALNQKPTRKGCAGPFDAPTI